ncbi:MAG TPA: SPOR domain-containing protein [Candidatus Eisenbacteria bacterium]
MAIETDVERYADPQGFAREVNLPLLGVARVPPVPAGAPAARLLTASAADALAPIVDGLVETRRSLSLHTLLLAGFPHDPECLAIGLALGREWGRRGLTVAVVDLDFWNPTIVRPADEPNEGFVDVLEYGCSFGRVAWEIVADRLWVVGPGSHPPDEDRIAEHPDWARAARVFSGRVDVTLFVAPLLDRRGFTGKLSKRMDAALLLASVERTTRGDLRDAFLELWGSDAPMIGCVGIESVAAERPMAPPAPPAHPVPPAEREEAASPSATLAGAGARLDEAPAAARVPAAAATAAARVPAAAAPSARDASLAAVRSAEEDSGEGADVVASLEREVRRGIVRRKKSAGFGKAALWVGIAAVIAVAAAIFDLVKTSDLSPGSGAVQSPQPAGEEPVGSPPQAPLQSDLGAAPQGALPGGGAPAASLPFRVHVASFRSEAKVAGIVSDLKAKGLDAWYEPADDLPGWYRVFVGRFKTEEEARAYAIQLLDARVVDRAHSYPSTAR